MDTWKFFDITHRDHVLCNPLSETKLDEMIRLLDLPPCVRVLDIACGKGRLPLCLAERHATRGVGVDLSPSCVADLRSLAAVRAPDADLELLTMDGADYRGTPGKLRRCLVRRSPRGVRHPRRERRGGRLAGPGADLRARGRRG